MNLPEEIDTENNDQKVNEIREKNTKESEEREPRKEKGKCGCLIF